MLTLEALAVPLAEDGAGCLRVPGTRVSLDFLVADYKAGMSPEDIHRAHPAVSAGDLYTIFAYYLSHTNEVEAYLERRGREADELRARVERDFPMSDALRTRLASGRDATSAA
jgi:uncharacterized protein (DUF433 family)